MSENKELALFQYSEIEKMGAAIAKSGLFGMKTPGQAIALMLIAQAQGRHPASVAMEYDIIQDKPALKSQAALMRFQEAGGKIKYITRTDAEVSAEFSHPAGGTVTVSWDMKRAAKMGLSDKDNWKKQSMIMLQWRVVSEGVRACFPACLGGSYLVEEVQDFTPSKSTSRDVTPVQTEKTSSPIETSAQDVAYTMGGDVIDHETGEVSEPTISEPQQKRFFAIAKSTGASNDAIKSWLKKEFGIEHTKDMKRSVYDDACDRVLQVFIPKEPRQPGSEG
jgi:hypothetical protein